MIIFTNGISLTFRRSLCLTWSSSRISNSSTNRKTNKSGSGSAIAMTGPHFLQFRKMCHKTVLQTIWGEQSLFANNERQKHQKEFKYQIMDKLCNVALFPGIPSKAQHNNKTEKTNIWICSTSTQRVCVRVWYICIACKYSYRGSHHVKPREIWLIHKCNKTHQTCERQLPPPHPHPLLYQLLKVTPATPASWFKHHRNVILITLAEVSSVILISCLALLYTGATACNKRAITSECGKGIIWNPWGYFLWETEVFLALINC